MSMNLLLNLWLLSPHIFWLDDMKFASRLFLLRDYYWLRMTSGDYVMIKKVLRPRWLISYSREEGWKLRKITGISGAAENGKMQQSIPNIIPYVLVKFGIKIHVLSWVGRCISGLTSGPEVENMTLHQFRVYSIHPQSFVPIGQGISEI